MITLFALAFDRQLYLVREWWSIFLVGRVSHIIL
jgi:hypothetical protein